MSKIGNGAVAWCALSFEHQYQRRHGNTLFIGPHRPTREIACPLTLRRGAPIPLYGTDKGNYAVDQTTRNTDHFSPAARAYFGHRLRGLHESRFGASGRRCEIYAVPTGEFPVGGMFNPRQQPRGDLWDTVAGLDQRGKLAIVKVSEGSDNGSTKLMSP